MWISKLELHDYRAFQKKCSIELGKNITVIAGMNGIGKSTILAVLTNVGELGKNYKTLNGKRFRGNFPDLIMYDEKFDSTGDKATIFFSDLPNNEQKYNVSSKIIFRASKHTAYKTKNTYKKIANTDKYTKTSKRETYTRYRLIPKNNKAHNNSRKVNWPSLYLGLSRLAPLGEYDSANTEKIPNDFSKEILKAHKKILSESFNTANVLNVDVGARHMKATVDSENYGYAANSNGQDNTGQIIESVLSFQKLKSDLGNEYIGGILAIDELDASLHPAAQNKIFDWLLEKSKELNLQIIFTTHSLSLLEYANRFHKKEKGIIINYLMRTIPGTIKVIKNPSSSLYRHNLQETYAHMSSESKQIIVYSEDKVTRMFLEKILKVENKTNILDHLKFLDINISWSKLIDLACLDSETLKNHLFFLDPDLSLDNKDSELKKYIDDKDYNQFGINSEKSNIFILPGEESIEKMLWNYVNKLNGDHDLFNDSYIINSGVTPQIIREWNQTQQQNESNFYKHWFNDINKNGYITYFMKYWINDNQNKVKKFCGILESAYNRILKSLEE